MRRKQFSPQRNRFSKETTRGCVILVSFDSLSMTEHMMFGCAVGSCRSTESFLNRFLLALVGTPELYAALVALIFRNSQVRVPVLSSDPFHLVVSNRKRRVNR